MGTGLLEQTVTNHPDVIEVSNSSLSTAVRLLMCFPLCLLQCCVVGAPDKMKGQIPLALVVARGQNKDGAAMFKSINEHLRAEVGPISRECFSGSLLCTTAPLTRTSSRRTRSASLHHCAAQDEERQDAAQGGQDYLRACCGRQEERREVTPYPAHHRQHGGGAPGRHGHRAPLWPT